MSNFLRAATATRPSLRLMNQIRHTSNRSTTSTLTTGSSSGVAKAIITVRENSSFCHATIPASLPVKEGTPIKGLDFFKEQEQVVALKRNEYPEFVDQLAEPLPSLAVLRRMPQEEADDKLMRRYLKLKRRMVIKANNTSREK